MRRMIDLFRKALSGEEREYTSGCIRTALILLSIPMILEMLMESLFALVDAYFVARLGANAMATVGLTETVITLVYSLAIGLSTAPVAMIARFVGQKNKEGAAKVAKQTIIMGIGMSAIVGALGLYFAPDILRLMGGSEQLIADGVNYTRIIFGTNVVIMLLFLLNGIFRGAGAATYAMRALWIANGINIILDPILINGLGPIPAMGLTGAAVATSIGRGIGVAYQLYILFGGHTNIKLRTGSWAIDGSIMRRLIKIASTGAIQYIIASASWIFLMRIVSSFGSEYVAGYTIAIRLIIFTILPAWGFANATATLVGQNLGAEKPDRVVRSVRLATIYNVSFMLVVSALYLLFARQLISFFDSTPVVLNAGKTALKIFAIGYTFYGVGMILIQAFNGAGDTRTPTLINFICFWLIEIPLGYYLGIHLNWNIDGVSWAVVIAEGIMTAIAIYLFRRGKWKKTVV